MQNILRTVLFIVFKTYTPILSILRFIENSTYAIRINADFVKFSPRRYGTRQCAVGSSLIIWACLLTVMHFCHPSHTHALMTLVIPQRCNNSIIMQLSNTLFSRFKQYLNPLLLVKMPFCISVEWGFSFKPEKSRENSAPHLGQQPVFACTNRMSHWSQSKIDICDAHLTSMIQPAAATVTYLTERDFPWAPQIYWPHHLNRPSLILCTTCFWRLNHCDRHLLSLTKSNVLGARSQITRIQAERFCGFNVFNRDSEDLLPCNKPALPCRFLLSHPPNSPLFRAYFCIHSI